MIPEGFVETTPEPEVRTWVRGPLKIFHRPSNPHGFVVQAQKISAANANRTKIMAWQAGDDLPGAIAKAEAWLEDPR